MDDRPRVPKPANTLASPSEQKGAMLVNPGTPAPPTPAKLGAPPQSGMFLVNPGTPSAPPPAPPKE